MREDLERIESELGAISFRLRYMTRLLEYVVKLEVKMANELQTLEAQVAKNTEVEQSAIVLIQGIAQMLKDAGTDPAKLAALAATLDTSAQQLGAAVAANTPAAPTARRHA